jgi:hypothetical protein
LTAVFATSYFPSLYYLKALCEAENPIIDLGEHYKKQTERTRVNFMTSNGISRLSIPVIRPFGNKTATKDVQISFAENWKRNHCRSIEAAYASSPYFEHYANEVFELINSNISSLHEFNHSILIKIINWLELPINLNYSKKYIENLIEDYREFNFHYAPLKYKQVDFGQIEFLDKVSVLDALFCLGPMTRKLIII